MLRALLLILALAPGVALSQGTDVSFGAIGRNIDSPVEITADTLQIDQENGRATFVGNVVVGQGEMRLTGDEVEVAYATDNGGPGAVEELEARGNVTFVSGDEAAEARNGRYTVAGAQLVLTGDVVLTQGTTTIAGDRLTVDVAAGAGVMEGRVRVVFQPEAQP